MGPEFGRAWAFVLIALMPVSYLLKKFVFKKLGFGSYECLCFALGVTLLFVPMPLIYVVPGYFLLSAIGSVIDRYLPHLVGQEHSWFTPVKWLVVCVAAYSYFDWSIKGTLVISEQFATWENGPDAGQFERAGLIVEQQPIAKKGIERESRMIIIRSGNARGYSFISTDYFKGPNGIVTAEELGNTLSEWATPSLEQRSTLSSN